MTPDLYDLIYDLEESECSESDLYDLYVLGIEES